MLKFSFFKIERGDIFQQFSFLYLSMSGLTRLKTGRTNQIRKGEIAQVALEPTKVSPKLHNYLWS